MSAGDNKLSSDKVSSDISGVKVPYSKAYSYPPNRDKNFMSLDVDEPPPSAPPQGLDNNRSKS